MVTGPRLAGRGRRDAGAAGVRAAREGAQQRALLRGPRDPLELRAVRAAAVRHSRSRRPPLVLGVEVWASELGSVSVLLASALVSALVLASRGATGGEGTLASPPYRVPLLRPRSFRRKVNKRLAAGAEVAPLAEVA